MRTQTGPARLKNSARARPGQARLTPLLSTYTLYLLVYMHRESWRNNLCVGNRETK